MLVVGIDPGLLVTGYGIIVLKERNPILKEAGVIRTTHKKLLEERMVVLYSAISSMLEEYKPTTVVIEELYSHYKHPKTSILMGHARGVICLTAAQLKIPVIHYPSTKIKSSITGNGRASKIQVQRMVQSILHLQNLPEPPDVADALAIALCHINTISQQSSITSPIPVRRNL